MFAFNSGRNIRNIYALFWIETQITVAKLEEKNTSRKFWNKNSKTSKAFKCEMGDDVM